FRWKGPFEAIAGHGVGLSPGRCVDGGAIRRIDPTTVYQHGRVFIGSQHRRQDVDARRSIASAESVDDLLSVIVDPPDMNSAEMRLGGVGRQRVEADFWRKSPPGKNRVCRLPCLQAPNLPASATQTHDREEGS